MAAIKLAYLNPSLSLSLSLSLSPSLFAPQRPQDVESITASDLALEVCFFAKSLATPCNAMASPASANCKWDGSQDRRVACPLIKQFSCNALILGSSLPHTLESATKSVSADGAACARDGVALGDDRGRSEIPSWFRSPVFPPMKKFP
jgi:hypothetical protein